MSSAPPVAEQKDNVTNEGETVQERFVPLSRDQEQAINEAKDTLKDAEWKAKLKQKMNPTWFEDYKCQSCGTDPDCCWVNYSKTIAGSVNLRKKLWILCHLWQETSQRRLHCPQCGVHIIIAFEVKNAIQNVM